MQLYNVSSSHPDHFAQQTLHIRSNFRMNRGIACIMLQTGQYKTRTADYGLRTTDYGLGIKHGLGIKRGLSITDWV